MAACPSCGLPAPHNGPCPNSHTLAKESLVLQGRYEIVDVLGQGGMGTVYMARDLRLNGRDCVVKKLRDDFQNDEQFQRAQSFFEREMSVLAKLEHPNIVHISDYFKEGYDRYLVMEYVKGNDLHYILTNSRQGQPFDENVVVNWAVEICEVLNYLHEASVIYRDLKPSNIMIDLKNQVKLVDFGIARTWEEERAGEYTQVVSAGYSPPEQYWGAATPQSDIYALGTTMFFLLTGRDPEALHASSPRTINQDITEYIDQLVQKATAQDPNDRFQSADQMREALLKTDYVSAPETPRSRLVEVAVWVALIVVAGFLFLGTGALDSAFKKDDQGKETASTAEDNKIIEQRPAVPATTTSNLNKSAGGNADLAVQDMDEANISDPAGNR